jgi:hypothetical protein
MHINYITLHIIYVMLQFISFTVHINFIMLNFFFLLCILIMFCCTTFLLYCIFFMYFDSFVLHINECFYYAQGEENEITCNITKIMYNTI